MPRRLCSRVTQQRLRPKKGNADETVTRLPPSKGQAAWRPYWCSRRVRHTTHTYTHTHIHTYTAIRLYSACSMSFQETQAREPGSCILVYLARVWRDNSRVAGRRHIHMIQASRGARKQETGSKRPGKFRIL